jgi:hypothetical protein
VEFVGGWECGEMKLEGAVDVPHWRDDHEFSIHVAPKFVEVLFSLVNVICHGF